MTNIIFKPITFLLDVNFLAKRNNSFCCFLNRIINSCHISPLVKIPKTTKFLHGGVGVIIGKGSVIGENVIIYHNVTLGKKDYYENKNNEKPYSEVYPEIEDNVLIGTGSIILGKTKIGENSTIGAGSLVNKDIPQNSIAYNKREMVIFAKEQNNEGVENG